MKHLICNLALLVLLMIAVLFMVNGDAVHAVLTTTSNSTTADADAVPAVFKRVTREICATYKIKPVNGNDSKYRCVFYRDQECKKVAEVAEEHSIGQCQMLIPPKGSMKVT
eukprot:Nk52_evm1s2224 gene=Nk52_evmTU1s2224